MLGKKYRLSKKLDVLRVLKKGMFVNGGLVNLKYLLREQYLGINVVKFVQKDERSRITVVVGKKILRRAVDRNRAKRLVRASVFNLLNKVKGGYDLVFLVQSEIVNKKQVEVESVVKVLLVKAGLIDL